MMCIAGNTAAKWGAVSIENTTATTVLTWSSYSPRRALRQAQLPEKLAEFIHFLDPDRAGFLRVRPLGQ